jgi:hypothetical protein
MFTSQDGVSLLVANLTVIAGFVFKIIEGSGGDSTDAHDNRRPLYHTFAPSRRREDVSMYDSEMAPVQVHIERETNDWWSESAGAPANKVFELKSMQQDEPIGSGKNAKDHRY